MRRSTQLALLLLVVAVVLFGWKAVGLTLFFLFVLPPLLVLAVGLGFFFWARRRMARRMAELRQVFEENAKAGGPHPDAIDVEAKDVRDEAP